MFGSVCVLICVSVCFVGCEKCFMDVVCCCVSNGANGIKTCDLWENKNRMQKGIKSQFSINVNNMCKLNLDII